MHLNANWDHPPENRCIFFCFGGILMMRIQIKLYFNYDPCIERFGIIFVTWWLDGRIWDSFLKQKWKSCWWTRRKDSLLLISINNIWNRSLNSDITNIIIIIIIIELVKWFIILDFRWFLTTLLLSLPDQNIFSLLIN